ncbi:MAG: tRNA (adenosine(37)-N6)-dimethylallyltransferase MiaA [Pirellulaceae bacterium]|nr:tRNA (adenosine(37)-N6)-dimethylallyltransferase MiaA [Pirellulaceae bacterium]
MDATCRSPRRCRTIRPLSKSAYRRFPVSDWQTAFQACWFLTGPTASGKTRVGLTLAEALDAEIVSLDSMAVYRGMDIGTAKPTDEQRGRVPHHLLDLVDPTDDFSVSQYLEAAADCVTRIRQRGKEVLFVGGTPLYLKALLRGLSHGPPADWDFRREIDEELQAVGLEVLHQRLWQVDPLAAARLHPHDKRRIIRALEVYKLTGRPISHEQLHFDEGLPAERCRVFVLGWPRAALHRRIEQRVDWMFSAGLVAEVQGLLDRFGSLGRTAAQAVGYREVLEQLAGKRTESETAEAVKARTRQFARRQETWFRSLCECRRLEVAADADLERLAPTLLELGRQV